jgi:type IV secretory pathway TraG/TraD family ATPase VirD4
MPLSRHIRGARLIGPGGLSAKLNPWWPWGRGLRLGNVSLPRRLETEHCLILGSQGSGKSSLLRSILQQVEKRDEPCIVVDPECEFVSEFYKPSRGDYILNPLDERGPFWSPWLEFRDDQKAMDIQAMVASLIRTRARTPAESYWQSEGRRLLERLFLQTTNLGTLRNLAAKDKSDGREGVINALQPLSLLPVESQCQRELQLHPHRWSALQWAQERKGPHPAGSSWLFLTSTEDSRPSVLALQGIWLDLLIRRLMSSEIGGSQVFVVADEVATMGYQPQLEQSLITRGRKRGIAVILSLQNIAQLRVIYGHDPTITLAAQPGTLVLLKCGEPETAEWASKLIGEHEVEEWI